MTLATADSSDRSQRAWLDLLQTAVVLLTPELNIHSANAAAQALLGRSARQLDGEPMQRMAKNAPDLKDKAQRVLRENTLLTERGFRLECADGATVLVDAVFSPILTQPGVAVAMEMHRIARDQYPLGNGGMDIQSAAYSDFLKGLRHEIKNPLGGMRGAAQLLGRQIEPGLHEYVDIIISEVDRLNRLVDRLDQTPRKEKKCAANIHRLLEHVVSLAASDSTGPLDLQRDYDPSVPDLNLHPELLVQAFLNLATNAINAQASSLRIRTRIEFGSAVGDKGTGTSLRIDFTDNGVGVPPELGDRIFLPMVTGRSEGTGIGLAMVSAAAQAHHGSIAFESEPGNTTFTLLIPMESPNEH